MPRLLRITVFATALLLACLTLAPSAPRAADQSTLQQTIDRAGARERNLSGSAARLGGLISGLSSQITALSQREAAVQAQLDSSRAKLAATQKGLRDSQAHLGRLRARLARGRHTLAAQLVASYTDRRPDLVSVVLGARGFSDLIERADALKFVAQSNANVVHDVRGARDATHRETRILASLQVRQREAAIVIGRQRAALAAMDAGLQARRSSIASARSAQLAALANTRAGRRRAEGELGRLLAAQARAAVSSAGPGGPWAIPWAIVQCESGGQNLPPNPASASGYYQFLDSTWKGLGGSTKHAFQASKAEQDRLAARLWAGGAGAGNWVCAGIVGIG